MKNLTGVKSIKLKGLLFLAIGVMALGLLWTAHPQWDVAVFSSLAVWAFCRFYYFAFYVIERYVDDRFRFSGLGSFAWYLMTGRADSDGKKANPAPDSSTGKEPPS